jgi:hypothetical protein
MVEKFNTVANSFVCSLTFPLHNFSNFVEEHTFYVMYWVVTHNHPCP